MITVTIAYVVVLMGPYGYVDDSKMSSTQNYGWTQEQCNSIIIPLNQTMKTDIGNINYYACLPYPKVVEGY